MASPALPEIIVNPASAGVTVVDNDPSISVLWDQAIQAAVIEEAVGPTIASRAYAIMHTAIFEAWAAYDPTAVGTVLGDLAQQEDDQITDVNKAEAMSYAAYVAASSLFPEQQSIFDDVMESLGYATDVVGLSPVAALGIGLGSAVVVSALDDGANQLNGYADNSGYTPVNADPDSQISIEHWTPEYVPIDSGENLQEFLTPHWGGVDLFAASNADLPAYAVVEGVVAEIDMAEGTITIAGLDEDSTWRDFREFRKEMREAFRDTDDWPEVRAFLRDAKDAMLGGDEPEPLVLDLSDALYGPVLDPGAPLPQPEPFFVDTIKAELNMADKTVTLTGLADDATWRDFRELKNALRDEYLGTEDWPEVRGFIRDLRAELKWGAEVDPITLEVTDGLVGEVINEAFISQAEALIETQANLTIDEKRIAEFWEDGGGTSFPPGTWMTFAQFVSARDDHSLDQDAQLFFAMANAVKDAGISTWGLKAEVDYARPVAVIRDLGELGLIGEEGVDYLGQSGPVIQGWAGPGLGTQTILVEDFITYQNPNGPASPPFAEYTSGHSTFSAAAAEVLRQFTGSDDFGGSVEIRLHLVRAH